MRQLALDLQGPRGFREEGFVDGPAYEEARAHLAAPEGWPRGGLVLHGPAASGKSHLAALWARRRGAVIVSAADLDDRAWSGLAGGRAIVLDRADASASEEAFLHLVNLAHEDRAPMLLIARRPAAAWTVRLADLRSRLLAMGSAAIAEAPDDALARGLLARRLRDAGLVTAPDVVDYLLARAERSFSAIDRLVREAERLTLEEKRGLTKPLAAKILASS